MKKLALAAILAAVTLHAAATRVDLSKEQVGRPPATFEPICAPRRPNSRTHRSSSPAAKSGSCIGIVANPANLFG